MEAEMTPEETAVLDECVCRFLGIEPSRWCKTVEERQEWEARGCPHDWPSHYPAVSTSWQGFGMVVEALPKHNLTWAHAPSGWVRIYKEELDSEGRLTMLSLTAKAELPLPMKLSLAVQQLAKERG